MMYSADIAIPRRSLNHSRYAVNDETLYVAPSDKRTDYSQPPMNNFYYGVLNTGRRRYAHPALTGSLPYPWLPVKATPKQFGDGAAQRRGVVLSLRRKVARKLRRTQGSDTDGEGSGSNSREIPEGWSTGRNLSRSRSRSKSDGGGPSRSGGTDTDVGSASDGLSAGGGGAKLSSSVSSATNPWGDPTPEPSRSGSGSISNLKKRMSFDPASGVIALPEEDNIWGDEGDEGEGSENESEGGTRWGRAWDARVARE